MTINESKFIYANESSEKYDVMLCSIESVNTETNDDETTIISSTTPFKQTWDFHGLQKASPLSFQITIAKKQGGYLDSNEQRALKKWLCKPNFNWLQVVQSDLGNTFYYCIITNPRPVSIGSMTGGFTFTVTCNSTCAYSRVYKKDYVSSGTLNFTQNMNFDYDEYTLYPQVKITPTANGIITLKNNTTNTTVTISNCVATEVILMDGNLDMIESSNGRVLLDSWTKNFLCFIEGKNDISITGKCKVEISYRLPIRVGG